MVNPEILTQITDDDLNQLSDLEFAMLWKIFKVHDDWRIEQECRAKLNADVQIWKTMTAIEVAEEELRRDKMEMYGM